MSSRSSRDQPQTRAPVAFATSRHQAMRNEQQSNKRAGQEVKWDGKRSTYRMSRCTTYGPRPGLRRSGAPTPPLLSQKLAAAAVAALTYTKGGLR